MIILRRKWLLFLSPLMLASCDAMLQMTYVVKNKSDSDVKLFVPDFPIDSLPRMFGNRNDTTLILKPDEEIIVGIGSKIDFPWGRRNIYRNKPGICGIKKISNDTVIVLGCTDKEWKYRQGQSCLKLK